VASADIVSVHLALNPGTKALLGARFFSAMREGAYFINTARSLEHVEGQDRHPPSPSLWRTSCPAAPDSR
jgi:hypothetical protein